MTSLQPALTSLLKSLPVGTVEQHKLDAAVERTLTDSKGKSSPENRKSQWEYLLKNEIFILAATEGKALKDEEMTYYDQLRYKLDLILTFTEHDACEQTFPFIVLQDLLETQTIASCSHIFSWIEARASRLTDGMVPQKGKALILLRTLNDLLRRLSKMGSTTIFCGRILTFLSGVFPLGERSGVNLRGEYGPTWEGVKDAGKAVADANAEIEPDDEAGGSKESKEVGDDDDKMQVDTNQTKRPPPSQTPPASKEEFYNTFWSLQLPFSKPPLFSAKNTFSEFKAAVNRVLPTIKEATAKERAMMGSRSSSGTTATLKRKREPDADEVNTTDYFFAKFLTSPDLLDLEIADTHFRRQFLFQLLILLNHLLTFTKTTKLTWSTSRNRSLQMDFTLEPDDAQWVQETVNKTMEELRQTTPNGRAFAETVNIILEREKNWVKWKNELCAPFDKEPWFTELDGKKVGLLEATKNVREQMREPPPDWEWRLGTEPLTEIWDMGYRDLHDLQNPFQPGDVKDFVKKVKLEDARIEMRKKRLVQTAERLAQAQARAAAKVSTPDPDKEIDASAKIPEPSLPPSDPALPSLAVPRSTAGTVVTNPASSPLHPSLPAKPGSSSPAKTLPSSQDSGITSTPASAVPPVIAISAPDPVVTAPTPAAVTNVPTVTKDDQIMKYNENKQRWAWLALRTARDQHLQHFGKIGTGDIELLAQEIDKEEKEKLHKSEEMQGIAEDQRAGSPTVAPVPPGGAEETHVPEPLPKMDPEGDVKMEDR